MKKLRIGKKNDSPRLRDEDTNYPIPDEKKSDIFEDPRGKIDEMLAKRANPSTNDAAGTSRIPPSELYGKSDQLQKALDNFRFQKKVSEKPILMERRYKGFRGEYVDLGAFLNMRIWPRSIYVTDKLIRLVASAKLEMLKKYIAKKRAVPLNILWILLLMVGIAMAVLVILFLLPNLGGVPV